MSLSEAERAVQYSPNFCACGCGGHPRNFYAEYIAGHRPKSDPIPRFWAKVAQSGECWIWTGAVGDHGYGSFWDGSVFVLAHRYALKLAGGLSDSSLHVDHLCRNRVCVRAEHLEAVTQQVNNARAVPHRTVKTHCRRGHDFAETGFLNTAGYRECRACIDMRLAERKRRRARG